MKSSPTSFNLSNEVAARLFRVATAQYFHDDPTRYDVPKDHSRKILYEFCRIILSEPYFASVKQVMELTGLSRYFTYDVMRRHQLDTKQEYQRSCDWVFQSRRK